MKKELSENSILSVDQNQVSISQLQVSGAATFSGEKIIFSFDGTINAGSLQVNPDGSMQIGLALAISKDGTVTVNGAPLVVLNDVVFKNSTVGPVLLSDSLNFFRIRVKDDGTLYTEPASISV